MPTATWRHATAKMPLPQLAFPPNYRANDAMIGTWSRCAIGEEVTAYGAANWASATYPSTDTAYAYQFSIADPFLVAKVWWVNGTTATTDTAEVGVYTEAGALMVASTAATVATANVVQEADCTDTLLVPGRYWCAYVQNGVTATPRASAINAQLLRIAGCAQMASARPLPATFVPAAYSSNGIQLFGIANRTQVG